MNEAVKLLCIDDDKNFLSLISMFFQRLGYAVSTALDGREGLALYAEERPDIILVDLNMPQVDGFTVLEQVARQSPDIPVIVISGEGGMDDVIRALRLGAWNYHTKPVSRLEVLRYSVEQALEKARLGRENISYQQELEGKVKQRTRELEATLQSLKQSEQKLSTIIESFEGFIFICDRHCRITFMNAFLLKYLGRDATGEICHQAVFQRTAPCSWCADTGLPVEGQSIREEFYNSVDNRWYYVIHTPIFDQQGEMNQRLILFYDISERKQKEQELKEREEYFRKENMRLRASLTDRYKFGDIIGKSPKMQEVYELILNAAASDVNVIIYGESGTGKELVAKAIHEHSDRKNKKLFYVNCGAIPESLFESEFFGHKKGAFTGAIDDKHGYLDMADGGTLFLDEIGEIPISMQIKLLRAIEGNGFTPVGGAEIKRPAVRFIAATNRDLKEAVRQGRMRQDFLYRIHVIPICLPLLRERKEDIPLLIEHFLSQYEPDKVPPVSPKIIKALQSYDWPGNVRELQNTLHRFVTLKKLDFMGTVIDAAEEKPFADTSQNMEALTYEEALERFEKKILFNALQHNKWHQGNTATALKVNPKTLYRKMKQYGFLKLKK
ncbi:MAG: sigma 54-interacting transcriptional regulator [Proteobacteria bacterium]|nr:sigma 54-interacting transcriptional regulator [Pseudomonadota bacterium]MBU0965200.1 sigma 54-interacting transcriptional regulator [Pseudomonadota bacterium]